MTKIKHQGPKRTTATVEQAATLLHAIANGLSLKTEFQLTYDKSEAGSELRLVMIPPKVELIGGVVVDSANKAVSDVGAAEDAVPNAKTTKHNATSTATTAP